MYLHVLGVNVLWLPLGMFKFFFVNKNIILWKQRGYKASIHRNSSPELLESPCRAVRAASTGADHIQSTIYYIFRLKKTPAGPPMHYSLKNKNPYDHLKFPDQEGTQARPSKLEKHKNRGPYEPRGKDYRRSWPMHTRTRKTMRPLRRRSSGHHP